MNRQVFFTSVRKAPFGGKLSQLQVAGMGAILDEWDKRGLTDTRWLAYMLATTFHETDRSMQPIREYGRGKGRKYGTTYYGRGFVQLTWEANYRKASTVVGVDLVAHPDRALELPLAATILFDGMIKGWFTSKKLSDFITPAVVDYKNARRIINGTDKAAMIANYAVSFENALSAAAHASVAERLVPLATLPPIPPIVTTAAAAAMSSSPIGAILSRVLHRDDVPMLNADVPATVGKVMTALGSAMDTGKVAVVAVKSGWLSKINLIQLAGPIATVLATVGVGVSEQQINSVVLAVPVVMQILQSIITWITRTWFTSSVTAASMVPPITKE